MEKIKWPEKVTKELVFKRITEKRTLLNYILKRSCLLQDAIKGQMTELRGVGRRRTQIIDDLRNSRRC